MIFGFCSYLFTETTLKEVVFAGNNFREYHDIRTIWRKLNFSREIFGLDELAKIQTYNEEDTKTPFFMNNVSFLLKNPSKSKITEKHIFLKYLFAKINSRKKPIRKNKFLRKNKSPGNDGITKEVHEAFWDDLKTSLLLSVNKDFEVGELSISQKQAVIKLIGKKDKDKQIIKNWRPISLLNIDTNSVSKVLAERLKTALLSQMSSNQTAYLNGRLVSEGIEL